MAYRRLSLADGFLEFVVDGPDDARDLLIFHGGTPSAAVTYRGLAAAAAARGIKVASYSRGGYGTSTRREGRTVADEAALTAALADRLGFERFFVMGWSGGGPMALASAALVPGRVRACMTLAGTASRIEAGAAWRTLLPPQKLRDWEELARADIASLVPDFEQAVALFSRMTVTKLTAIGGPRDERAIRYHVETEIDRDLVRSMRRAVANGYFGFLDDNLAQVRDWGFRVADIRIPVVVRQGALDKLVNEAQGRWLAETIPRARGTFLPDAGHGSICLPWSEVIDELVAAARDV